MAITSAVHGPMPGSAEQLLAGAVPVAAGVEHDVAVGQRVDQRDQRPLPRLRERQMRRIDLGEMLDAPETHGSDHR